MGGPLNNRSNLETSFRNRFLQNNPNTVVAMIGTLKFGLTRHRALLFKTLLSIVSVDCKLLIKTGRS